MIPITSALHHSTPLAQEVAAPGMENPEHSNKGRCGDGQEKEEEDEDVVSQQARV